LNDRVAVSKTSSQYLKSAIKEEFLLICCNMSSHGSFMRGLLMDRIRLLFHRTVRSIVSGRTYLFFFEVVAVSSHVCFDVWSSTPARQ